MSSAPWLLVGIPLSLLSLSVSDADSAEPITASARLRNATVDEKAAEHYLRAVRLSDTGNIAKAIEEFNRAYALKPHYPVLFNLGQLHFRLGQHANAFALLQRYLDAGALEIENSRRQQVLTQLKVLRNRTGHLTLRTNVVGATLFAQGKLLGHSPLAKSFRVDAGPVTIRALKEGWTTTWQTVDVQGGSQVHAQLTLSPKLALRLPQTASSQFQWGWLASGGLALGAVGVGLATILSARKYELMQSRQVEPGSELLARNRLDRQRDLVVNLSRTTDALALTGLSVAAVTLYYSSIVSPEVDGTEFAIGLTTTGIEAKARF